MADDDAELQEFRAWKKDRAEKARKNAKVRVFEIPAELAESILGGKGGGDEGDEGDEGKGGGGFFGDR